MSDNLLRSSPIQVLDSSFTIQIIPDGRTHEVRDIHMLSILSQILQICMWGNLLLVPGELRGFVFSCTVYNLKDECESRASDFIIRSILFFFISG